MTDNYTVRVRSVTTGAILRHTKVITMVDVKAQIKVFNRINWPGKTTVDVLRHSTVSVDMS